MRCASSHNLVMRLPISSVALLLGIAISASAAPRLPFPIPTTPLQAKPGDRHAFAGQVIAVDRTARTITLGMPMRFTFKVPPTTEIKVRKANAVDFEAIKAGVGAQVVAIRGANSWTAQKIELDLARTFPPEMSAKTVQGKTVTGPQATEYIAYEPPSETVNRNIDFGERSGLFLAAVRPDGTVASVRPIKSTGVKELDERATRRLMQMKFRPGALTEARIPFTVTRLGR